MKQYYAVYRTGPSTGYVDSGGHATELACRKTFEGNTYAEHFVVVYAASMAEALRLAGISLGAS